jgi:hypothetical protein
MHTNYQLTRPPALEGVLQSLFLVWYLSIDGLQHVRGARRLSAAATAPSGCFRGGATALQSSSCFGVLVCAALHGFNCYNTMLQQKLAAASGHSVSKLAGYVASPIGRRALELIPRL